jgi:hypothetical protein
MVSILPSLLASTPRAVPAMPKVRAELLMPSIWW